jgi:hypothetical protein
MQLATRGEGRLQREQPPAVERRFSQHQLAAA